MQNIFRIIFTSHHYLLSRLKYIMLSFSLPIFFPFVLDLLVVIFVAIT